jgi:deazaflavin-dependent oxidoreductase (nitroreductase family)
MRRNVRHVWPRAESRIYDELKVLRTAGLAEAAESFTGRRRRTTYAITNEGRAVLDRWLAEPPRAATVLESEAMLRVLLSGSADTTRPAVETLLREAADLADLAAGVGQEYLSGTAPFQDRVRWRALTNDFLASYALMLRSWGERTMEALDRAEEAGDPEADALALAHVAATMRRLEAGPATPRRPPSRLSSSRSTITREAAMTDFNTQVIEEFRANEGEVGGQFAGAPLLLLHTTGARSGKPRLHPVMYLADGDRYVVFASKAGAPEHPDWYHNLVAHPAASIEVGTETIAVNATEATGSEHDELYERQTKLFPTFGEYQAKTSRTIPVMILTPTAA